MYSDFICPFCYIGFEVFRKLKPEFDLELDWRGFQIHPDWPAEGMPASEWRNGMDANARRAVWDRIQTMATDAGFQMKPPEMLTNSRLSLEAAEFAKEAGLRARPSRNASIALTSTRERISAARRLSPISPRRLACRATTLNLALDSGRYSLRLKNNAMIAHQNGVSGVPTFFIGEYPLVGAQSEDVMRQVLQRVSERLAAAQ
jgi:predicted DsbA family dithiol-disulfide isomerase